MLCTVNNLVHQRNKVVHQSLGECPAQPTVDPNLVLPQVAATATRICAANHKLFHHFIPILSEIYEELI